MEGILVGIIVCAAVIVIVRHVYRVLTKGESDGCEGCAVNKMQNKSQRISLKREREF